MDKYFIVVLVFFYSTIVMASPVLSTKKAELTQVAHQIQQLQKTITLNQQQQKQVESELKNTEITIGDLSLQINDLNHLITQEQQKLAKLKASQKIILHKLTHQQAALSQQLRTAYQLNSLQPFKVILNQDNPNTVQRHLTYYQRLAKLRSNMIATMQETLTHLKNVASTIASNQQNLKTLLEKKQSQQEEQESAQSHRQELMTTLHQHVVSKQQELSGLLANQQALQDIVSQLQSQTESGMGHSFNQMRGQLQWPVKGTLMANFGSPLDVGNQRLAGVILKATQGTPVHAIAPGKVIFATWLRGFGLLIIINHGNNFMSLYGRNNTLYAKVGDKVSMGDTIAATGSSGGFEKASLYFEIRQNGIPINPNIWCR